MKELFARWSLESPAFFKKVNAFALWLVGIAGSVLLLDIPEGITIPPVVMTIAKYVVFAGGVIFGTGKAAVKSPAALEHKLEAKGVTPASEK